MEASHHPVLVAEVVAALGPPVRGLVVDATVGLGGHAEAVLAASPHATLLGLDVDAAALELAGRRLAPFGARVRLRHASYWDLAAVLADEGEASVDGVLFDLGVSSLQLDSPERGFSFRHDAPLDMRFSGEGMTAAELVASASERDLERILREFGEEPFARRIARALVHARSHGGVHSTGVLHRIVGAAVRHRRGRIDPATRTFQALRIATNQELAGLPSALDQAAEALKPAGRLAVIAFHSLEDRVVKRSFRRLSGRCVCPPGLPFCDCSPRTLLEVRTPHPVRPGDEELARNPRARSARLRVAERSAP